MDIDLFNKKVRELKEKGKKLYSNCYVNIAEISSENSTIISDESIVIFHREAGNIHRGYFYTTDWTDLELALSKYEDPVVIEFVTKKCDEYDSVMQHMGYTNINRLKRLSNVNIGGLFKENERFEIAEYANIADAEQVYQLLWETFDSKISHLPDLCEVKEAINLKQFVVCKDVSGKIVSVLQEVVSPKKYYFNQVINKGDKIKFHQMIKCCLYQYHQSGGKYAYSWVEEKNIASLKFFGKYGFQPDGMWTIVYSK